MQRYALPSGSKKEYLPGANANTKAVNTLQRWKHNTCRFLIGLEKLMEMQEKVLITFTNDKDRTRNCIYLLIHAHCKT